MGSRGGAHRVRRHGLVVLACAAAGVVTALALASQTPRTYQSESEVFVAAGKTPNGGGLYDRGRWAQERVKSYVSLVTSPTVMESVVTKLGLPMTPAALADRVTVTAPPDTVILRIAARDTSSTTAQSIANATATEFVKFAINLEGTDEGTPLVELRITEPAEVSTSPVTPRTEYEAALGLMIGAAAGLTVAALRERLEAEPEPGEEPRSPMAVVSEPETPRAARGL
jgi:succinoglycan biosynthesis transport protein ExoP